jgi:hypothetical protein
VRWQESRRVQLCCHAHCANIRLRPKTRSPEPIDCRPTAGALLATLVELSRLKPRMHLTQLLTRSAYGALRFRRSSTSLGTR